MEQWAYDMMYKHIEFLKALAEAQKIGEHEFTCPLCGSIARWSRAAGNNHLHARCNGCGISIME